MSTSDKRPKYLNLIKIRLPVPGILSIAHRISGVWMFLAMPVLIYLLELSTSGQAGFDQVQAVFDNPWVKLVLLVLVWSLAHHLMAGIRYLLIDMDIGVEKSPAFTGAIIVLVGGVLVALVALVMLL